MPDLIIFRIRDLSRELSGNVAILDGAVIRYTQLPVLGRFRPTFLDFIRRLGNTAVLLDLRLNCFDGSCSSFGLDTVRQALFRIIQQRSVPLLISIDGSGGRRTVVIVVTARSLRRGDESAIRRLYPPNASFGAEQIAACKRFTLWTCWVTIITHNRKLIVIVNWITEIMYACWNVWSLWTQDSV